MQPRLREPAKPMREPLAHTARASRIAGGEAPAWIRWARDLGIAATAGVFLALVGAMGTSDMPLLTRLAYWVPLMLVGGLAGHLVSVAIARIPLARTNPWVFGVLEAIILSIPLTLMVWGYTNLLFDGDMLPPALPYLFGAVLVISAAMTAIMMLASQPGRVTHAPPAGATASPVRFLERLPPKLMGAAIYAVSSEDHFLRLHTSKGSDLILMRLADAIGELEGLEGAQTHRSWWVAREAVESARREGDRLVLALKGGAEAPVSRPNVKALRDAGWF